MNRNIIPSPVISVVSEVLASHYNSHTKLNTLFEINGAPGDAPKGNCETKCKTWLRRCNDDTTLNPFQILARILQDYMEIEQNYNVQQQQCGRRIINKILAENGLFYQTGGQINKGKEGISTRTLEEILKGKELNEVEQEFTRALKSVEADPLQH